MSWAGVTELRPFFDVHFARIAAKGFFSLWNGYGSPGFTSGSFFSQLIAPNLAFAYSFESRPLMGSTGGTYGSP